MNARTPIEHRVWIRLLLVLALLLPSQVLLADLAVLVDEAVLVETSPEQQPDEADPDAPPVQDPVGDATDASYVSSGGWAAVVQDFIDAATYVFDFGTNTSVVAATLHLPIEEVYPQNDAAPLEIEVFSDNGVIEFTDYSIGFSEPVAELDAVGLTTVSIDVTGGIWTVPT